MATGLKGRWREEDLLQKIQGLPDEKVGEVIDFIEFLQRKDRGKLEDEFIRLAEKIRKQFKQKKLKREDVGEAVKWSRG